MGEVRRFRRRRTTPRDAVEIAWDRGLPPPGEAFVSQYRELVLECIYFRRWDAPGLQEWTGEHHPHARAWHDALRASRQR